MQVSKSISWRSYPLEVLRNGPCQWISWLFGCFWRNQMIWKLVFFVFLWSTKSTHGLCSPISKRPRWCGAFDSSMDSLDSTKKGISTLLWGTHAKFTAMCPCTGCFTIIHFEFRCFFLQNLHQIPLRETELDSFGQLSCHKRSQSVILSETNSSHLKMDGWSRRSFPFRANGLCSGCEPLGGLSAVVISKSEVGITGCTVATQRIIISLGELVALFKRPAA